MLDATICRDMLKHMIRESDAKMYKPKMRLARLEVYILVWIFITPDRWQSKTLMLSTNVDGKSLETEFSIAICRPTGDKW